MSVYRAKNKAGEFKSPFWQYDFQIGGVRFSGSTGETEKRRAQAVEKLKRTEAAEEIARAASVNMSSIDYVFDRFWDERGQHDAKHTTTFERMEALSDGLKGILTGRGRPHVIGEISDDVIASYVARRRGQKTRQGRLITPASVNRETQILRRILRRAQIIWKMPFAMPAWGEHLLPEPDERIVDLTSDAEQRILAEMREDFRPAARFMILSGLRRGNVLPLHPDAIDFERDVLTVKVKSKHPGGRTHILPITRPMKILIANELAHGHPDAVFTFVAERTLHKKGYVRGQRYPLHPEWLYREFKRAAAVCGFPDLKLHDLRHVAATRTLRATKDLRATQHQLAHTRISTTTKYAHVLVDDLRAAMEAAHGPGNYPGTASEEPAKKLK